MHHICVIVHHLYILHRFFIILRVVLFLPRLDFSLINTTGTGRCRAVKRSKSIEMCRVSESFRSVYSPTTSPMSLSAARAARPHTCAPNECPISLVVLGFRPANFSRKFNIRVTRLATSGTLLTDLQYMREPAASRQSIRITL